jgi:hypothetical protein
MIAIKNVSGRSLSREYCARQNLRSHSAIVDEDVWNRAQHRLAEQTQKRKAPSEDAHSFLAGKLFDDRGNRMGPSHAAKGGRRWRYYISRAVLKGRKQDAGSITRVPAAEIEAQVSIAVRALLASSERSTDGAGGPLGHPIYGSSRTTIDRLATTNKQRQDHASIDGSVRDAIERVTIGKGQIEVCLCEAAASEELDRIVTIPWTPPTRVRRPLAA